MHLILYYKIVVSKRSIQRLFILTVQAQPKLHTSYTVTKLACGCVPHPDHLQVLLKRVALACIVTSIDIEHVPSWSPTTSLLVLAAVRMTSVHCITVALQLHYFTVVQQRPCNLSNCRFVVQPCDMHRSSIMLNMSYVCR